jgi:hypothetical protein
MVGSNTCLLAGWAFVKRFDVPKRIGAWIKVKVANLGAGSGYLQPVI